MSGMIEEDDKRGVSRTVVDLESVSTWPAELLAYLDAHYQVFLDWANGPVRVGAATYDRAIYGLIDAMQPYAVVGWHCTRLTDREIVAIGTSGMSLPYVAMLIRRIDAAFEEGLLTTAVGERLKAKDQAHEPNRAGMVWFCFFPPRVAGESGIGDLLRLWGGEALYNSHDRHPETAAALRSLGTPSIVEAEVPVAFLEPHGGLAFKVVRRYLISRGYETREPCEHEDRVKQPLPADCIRRVVSFPTTDFMALSGCDSWHESLIRPRRGSSRNGRSEINKS
jgi:hypothetical protein